MLVRERQNKPAPKGYHYCMTEYEGVIHITHNGHVTKCGHPSKTILTDQQALDSDKNICHGCFPKRY